MWDCQNCGCRAIAESLALCPVCRKERGMPKAPAGAAPSNAAALPGETGYIDPEPGETPETAVVADLETALADAQAAASADAKKPKPTPAPAPEPRPH